MVLAVRQLAILKFLKCAEYLSADTDAVMAALEKTGHGMSQALFSYNTAQLCADGYLTRSYKKGKLRGRVRVYTLTAKGRDQVEAFEAVGAGEVGA